MKLWSASMRSPIFPKRSLTAAISIASSSFFLVFHELFLVLRSCCFLHTCISPFSFPNPTCPYLFPHLLPQCPCLNTLSLLLPFLPSTLSLLERLLFPPQSQLPSCPLLVCPFLQTLQLAFCLFKLSLCIIASPFNVHVLFSPASLLKPIPSSTTSLIV